MTEFERALMHRDEMSQEEAKICRQQATKTLYDMLDSGCSYDEIEDMLADEYGLEMDYIMDLI